jgi:hypothetical protein
MGAERENETQEFDPQAGKKEDSARRRCREELQGGETNDPSGREHQKRKNFHGRNAKDYAAASTLKSNTRALRIERQLIFLMAARSANGDQTYANHLLVR